MLKGVYEVNGENCLIKFSIIQNSLLTSERMVPIVIFFSNVAILTLCRLKTPKGILCKQGSFRSNATNEAFNQGLHCLLRQNPSFLFLEIITCRHLMGHHNLKGHCSKKVKNYISMHILVLPLKYAEITNNFLNVLG